MSYMRCRAARAMQIEFWRSAFSVSHGTLRHRARTSISPVTSEPHRVQEACPPCADGRSFRSQRVLFLTRPVTFLPWNRSALAQRHSLRSDIPPPSFAALGGHPRRRRSLRSGHILLPQPFGAHPSDQTENCALPCPKPRPTVVSLGRRSSLFCAD